MNAESDWTEFFRQYTKFIKLQIVKYLYFRNLVNLADDPDIIQDIYTEIAKKLILTQSPSAIENIRYLKAWVKEVSRNHTRDWIENYFRQKKMAQRIAENTGLSLDDPLQDGENRNYHEVIADPSTENPSENSDCTFTEKWLENLTQEELWALKLKVMFYDPLDDEEIKELAFFTDRTAPEMKKVIDEMMNELIKKKNSKDKDLKGAARNWAMLRSIESRLRERLHDENLSQQELEARQADIQKRRQRMEKLLHSARQLIEPTNKDIAKILKMPAEKSKQISVVIYRARQKLAAKKSPGIPGETDF
ncbi:MAG: hypothetical protein ACOC90_06540 [Bacteroidota bacterium]